MKFNNLTQDEKYIIEQKGTEYPFSGIYNDFFEEGVYLCKKCNAPLYKSEDKFKSSCGWPSFDDEIVGAIKKVPDIDGRRVEIVCQKCDGHLGHIFEGEDFTSKNIRHCVNSLSLNFNSQKENLQKAYFAAGCFWGVEFLFQKQSGVLEVISGYMGGDIENPTYEIICSGFSGHLEVIEVVFDENIVSYETLAKLFFEIHDFTQTNGQGPDIGSQYLSEIFYCDKNQKNIAEELIEQLKKKAYKVATTLRPKVKFYKAESYHQNYYNKSGKNPYCHSYRKIF